MSRDSRGDGDSEAVAAALEILGVRRLLLGVHDAAFPATSDEDTGRGSPFSRTGFDFLAFIRELGFTGLQLGPRGETEGDQASPYDGSVFSRNTLSVSLSRLTEEQPHLVSPSLLAQVVDGRPAGGDSHVPHAYVAAAHREALHRAHDSFVRGRESSSWGRDLEAELDAFSRRNQDWLEADALYPALALEHGGRPWPEWSGLDRRLFAPGEGEEESCRSRRRELLARHRREVGAYRFSQFLAHRQHERFREAARRLGLELFGDLQIGLAARDAWRLQRLFVPGLLLGAPPSRTNPEGQPWGYPVFDPRLSADPDEPGEVARLFERRIGKLLQEVDGVRIDHPHGLVDPWVYRSTGSTGSTGDTAAAVRAGARLRSSPGLDDFPELEAYAIPEAFQLAQDPATPRYADDWVRQLSPVQVDRYATLFDVVVGAVGESSRSSDLPIACEVLSTLPYPLAKVLERHRLGRFRVTQKSKLDDPDDVYRSENARPEDWILFGNHDTVPLWGLLPRWRREGELERRARYLARLLRPDVGADHQERLARELLSDVGLFAQACLAELFCSPARSVLVYFTDLLGFTEPYNRPGGVTPENWSLRIPGDFRRVHRERAGEGRALDLPGALAMALRSRPEGQRPTELIARLEAVAARSPRAR